MNSMTGFGAASRAMANANLSVEVSGVNRKQIETSINLPRRWSSLETPLRAIAAHSISRGRLQLSAKFEANEGEEKCIKIQESKLASLKIQVLSLQKELGQPISITLDALTRLGVLEECEQSELSPDEIWTTLESCSREALAKFCVMRAEEGERLKQDLLARIETLRGYREQIIQRAPAVAKHYRERLLTRLEECGLPLPENDERIIKEIALFCERSDISEEATRLSCHLDQFCHICEKDEAVGRSLDFLCQEIARELNTTGSKANDAQLAQLVVDAKTELEKIREQVQNVE